MSLAIVGAVVLVLCIMAYAMSHNTDSAVDLHDPKVIQERKDLYRKHRDDFRSNARAMQELREWKAKNDDYDYVELYVPPVSPLGEKRSRQSRAARYVKKSLKLRQEVCNADCIIALHSGSGMIPSNLVGKAGGSKPFTKSDTWFSEFESHNPASLILSESQDSYIIGNLASYDKRQYPEFKPGENTPEGQGFGHCFVISRKRIFNIVDPEATASRCAVLKEMKEHFITFWKTKDGSPKLLKRVRSTFDEQNHKLASNSGNAESHESLLCTLVKDFEALSESFVRCKPDDFEFAFHAYPANSVGHLHMHVFPKNDDLRKFSTKSHDWKTIPIEAVLEVEEEEDEGRVVESGSG